MNDFLGDFVAALQPAFWPALALAAGIAIRRPVGAILSAFAARVREGDELELGGVKFGPRKTTSTADTPDASITGDPDSLRLLFAVADLKRGYRKSTKALEVPGGCIVQVSTEVSLAGGSVAVAEALTFVPGVAVEPDATGKGAHLVRSEGGRA